MMGNLLFKLLHTCFEFLVATTPLNLLIDCLNYLIHSESKGLTGCFIALCSL